MSPITVGVGSFIMVLGTGLTYSYVTSDWNHMINFGAMSIYASAITTMLAAGLEKE